MGTTAIYKLRTPELGDLADGPQAFKNLADDVEKNMTNRRGWQAWREVAGPDGASGELINPNGTGQVLAPKNVGLTTIGWAEINITAQIVQEAGDVQRNWAGYLFGYMNGILIGSYRFHSHNLARHVTAPLIAQVDIPASMSSFTLSATASNDPNSSVPIRVWEVDMNIRQFGAPRT